MYYTLEECTDFKMFIHDIVQTFHIIITDAIILVVYEISFKMTCVHTY